MAKVAPFPKPIMRRIKGANALSLPTNGRLHLIWPIKQIPVNYAGSVLRSRRTTSTTSAGRGEPAALAAGRPGNAEAPSEAARRVLRDRGFSDAQIDRMDAIEAQHVYMSRIAPDAWEEEQAAARSV